MISKNSLNKWKISKVIRSISTNIIRKTRNTGSIRLLPMRT